LHTLLLQHLRKFVVVSEQLVNVVVPLLFCGSNAACVVKVLSQLNAAAFACTHEL